MTPAVTGNNFFSALNSPVALTEAVKFPLKSSPPKPIYLDNFAKSNFDFKSAESVILLIPFDLILALK